MSVKIKSNIPLIKSANERDVSLALRFMADAVHEEAYYNTPKDKGNLRNDVLKQVLGKKATIIWNKEYAKYQEDYQHKNYTTPGTGPHFAENSIKKIMNNSELHFRKAGIL